MEQGPSDARRAILRQWMHDNERGCTWVGRHLGYTRQYIANTVNGRFPFSEALVARCEDKLGIDFGYVGSRSVAARA